MCGIVGYIAKDEKAFTEPRQHFLRHALAMDTVRGVDSTGIISVYDGNRFDVKTARSLAPGDRYIHTKQWNKISRDGWATIGHNRAATAGKVTLGNAHPFRFGPVTLVHNGTLEHKGSSLPSYDKTLDVDSMQIALALSQAEPTEADAVLSLIEGAFAIVWTDTRDKSVNMARNGQRPLHFTYNKAETFMMFMSDGHMLTSLNKSLWKSHAQGESIYQLDTFKHLKWTYGSLVPEVSQFHPFHRPVQPNTKKTSTRTPSQNATNGGSLRDRIDARKALNNASRRGGTNLGEVCRPMKEAMAKSFELAPSMMLRFEPEDQFNLYENTVMVHGQVYLPHWGNTPWDAVIYNVPQTSADAYAARDWQVKPIGITRPISGSGDEPAVLCALIHTDWANYKEAAKGFIKGPDGKLVNSKWLDQLTEAGCIKCKSALSMHDMDRYAYVNRCNHLICEDCKWDGVHNG